MIKSAGAHAIHNGLTAIEETHELYHGEKVAFGTLVQLVLENAPEEEMGEVVDFCIETGLPVTLSQLGIKEVQPDRIMEVAKLAAAENDTLGNMPFEVMPEDVYAAIMGADAIGKYYQGEESICVTDILQENLKNGSVKKKASEMRRKEQGYWAGTSVFSFRAAALPLHGS